MRPGDSFDLTNPVDLQRAALSVSQQYINDVDLRYTKRHVAFDPYIVHVFSELLHGAEDVAFTSAGLKLLTRKVKAILLRHKEEPGKSKRDEKFGTSLHVARGDIAGTFIVYSPHGRVVLETGLVKPVFHIAKGFRLVLKNVTIQHIIPTNELMIIESGPAFFPINVNFQKVKKRNNVPGAFKIYSPLWLGEPDKNPYDQRKQGGGVITFD